MRFGGCQDIQLQGSRHAFAIRRISSSAVRNMPLQHLLRGTLDRASRVVEEQFLLLRCHLPKEVARLLPVILFYAVGMVTSVAFERERLLIAFRLVVPQSLAVRASAVVATRFPSVRILPSR
jgi:hypothetical protein